MGFLSFAWLVNTIDQPVLVPVSHVFFRRQDDLQRVHYSMTYDFSMSGNFSSAGQLSFFQMPYIQVARWQDAGWARDALFFLTYFGTGDWDEVTGDIHGWILVLLKSSEGCR